MTPFYGPKNRLRLRCERGRASSARGAESGTRKRNIRCSFRPLSFLSLYRHVHFFMTCIAHRAAHHPCKIGKSHRGADRSHVWFPALRTSIKPGCVVAVDAFAVCPGTHAVLMRAQDKWAQYRNNKRESTCESIALIPEIYHAGGCMKMRSRAMECANTVPNKCSFPSHTCVTPTSPTVRHQFDSRAATFSSFSVIILLDPKPGLVL